MLKNHGYFYRCLRSRALEKAGASYVKKPWVLLQVPTKLCVKKKAGASYVKKPWVLLQVPTKLCVKKKAS